MAKRQGDNRPVAHPCEDREGDQGAIAPIYHGLDRHSGDHGAHLLETREVAELSSLRGRSVLHRQAEIIDIRHVDF